MKDRGNASYTYGDIVSSMRANGWNGDPVDVVRLSDGQFTSIDNTRILAAREAGIEVQAVVHNFDEALPEEMLNRFPHPKQANTFATTWGEAIEYRILRQNATFRNEFYPVGSFDNPTLKYPKNK